MVASHFGSAYSYQVKACMQHFFQRIWDDETGQDLIEYALLAALVATGSAILIPGAVNDGMSHIYSRVNSCLIRFGNGGG